MPSFSPHIKRQLAILVICRFAEPFALTSVWPYLYFMVKSFGVPTKDIPKYVGIIAASFNFCQFLTGIWWGRASDKYGRRPMILVGLLGTFFASLMFGFSSSVWMAILARAMAGGLNGNVGILRTMVAELVPEKELQPRAYSLMPLTWTVASTIAPVMGGYLSEPVQKYPSIFKPGGILEKYPFAFPNIVCCALFTFAMVFGLFFVEETLESKRGRPDVFLQMGKKFENWLLPGSSNNAHSETRPLLSEDEEQYLSKKAKDEKPPTIREAFTRQSVLNIVLYLIIALHVTFDQLLPVFMSTPPNDPSTQHPPFRFSGGFGMNSNEVGKIFSIFGGLGMVVQFFIFPVVARKYGALACLRTAFMVFPVAFMVAPYTVLAPGAGQTLLTALVAVKKIAEVFIFPCITIMVTNSAPSLRVLGTLNGIATATSAFGRGLGPIIGGWLFSEGQKINCVVLPYFALTAVTVLGFIPLSEMIEMESPATRDKQAVDDATSLAETSALGNVEEEDIYDHRSNCVVCRRRSQDCRCDNEEEEESLPPYANCQP